MKQRTKRKILRWVFWGVVAAVIFAGAARYAVKPPSDQVPLSFDDTVALNYCVDGDTASFILNGEETRVRFLAVDAPELYRDDGTPEFYGQESAAGVCKLLSDASSIRLEYESAQRYDKYGRVLAWVWVDDRLLQRVMIEEGYAKVAYLYSPYKYSGELIVREMQARIKKIGLWQGE